MWAKSPIVEKVGEKWELTDLGRGVDYPMFESEEGYLGWIHRYALDGEFALEADQHQLVDDALTELGI